jgi:ATP-dependent helicase/DNAse subunit B
MADSRSGMLLDDPISLHGMHPDFLPIKYKQDGSVMATYQKNLYTMEQWDALMEKLSDVVEDIAGHMKCGDIAARPKKQKNTSPCEHCAYKAVCRSAI